jgi:hypothetical protein
MAISSTVTIVKSTLKLVVVVDVLAVREYKGCQI